MKVCPYFSPHPRRAFSLVELAFVLLLSGLIAGGAMMFFNASGRAKCYAETQAKLERVRNAVNVYAQSNDRFPLPARRNIGTTDPNYGREFDPTSPDGLIGAKLDMVGTGDDAVVFGALPFSTLSLSIEDATDCWGNKLSYAVTKVLTEPKDAAGDNKFLKGGPDGDGADGKIDIFTETASTSPFLKGAGWVVVSHGADELGAVKANYKHATNNRATRKWCNDTPGTPLAFASKTANCAADKPKLINAPINDGKTASADKFFDDVVAYRGKPWRVKAGSSNIGKVYCWGANDKGQLGNGAVGAAQGKPTPVVGPDGTLATSLTFKDITVGYSSACGLTESGKAYCWGTNWGGILGDGTTTHRYVPTPVIGPDGTLASALTFSNIYVGCGILAADHKAYCWGNGTTTPPYAPTSVVGPDGTLATALQFKSMAIGNHICGIDMSGKAYCWGGPNWAGWLGTGPASAIPVLIPTPVLGPDGTLASAITFTSISVQDSTTAMTADPTSRSGHTCGTASDGKAYCWGHVFCYQLGDTGGWFVGHSCIFGGYSEYPRQVITVDPMGTPIPPFASINANDGNSYALSPIGKAYAWGRTVAAGAGPIAGATLPLTPVDSDVFKSLSNDGGSRHECGLKASGKAYCWGEGDARIGDNNPLPGHRYSPTAVVGPGGTIADALSFSKIAVGYDYTCAIVGTP